MEDERKAVDRQTGISIRFIRQWEIDADRETSRIDMMDTTTAALMLAMHDPRDAPFSVKLRDALDYLTNLPDTDPLET